MKIAILGYCGSGKSTLAQHLGGFYEIPVLHFDCVHWLPGWVERDRGETGRIVAEFLDANDSWVMDGNYTRHHFDRRMAEADTIVILTFNRFACLYRALKRLHTYRGKNRASMTEGCPEKVDWPFVKWILWQGRGKKQKTIFRDVADRYPEKCVILKNQRQLTAYTRRFDKKAGQNREL